MEKLRLFTGGKRPPEQTWPSSPYASSDEDLSRMEKLRLIQNDDEFSPTTSRASSYSFEPVFRYAKAPQLALRTASQYTNKLPLRRFNRYFTLILASLTILFIITLTGLSRRSAAEVAQRVPPVEPPVYENFPFLMRYYGGIRTLVPREASMPEYPGDEEDFLAAIQNVTDEALHTNTKRDSSKKHAVPDSRPFLPYGEQSDLIEECFLDPVEKTRILPVRVYDGVPVGFPQNVMGSYEVLGLEGGMCFDRFGKLGPYGFGYSPRLGGTGAGLEGDREGAEQVWPEESEIDFRSIKWSEVQQRCVHANRHRFEGPTARFEHLSGWKVRTDGTDALETREIDFKHMEPIPDPQTSVTKKLPRTVVLLRTWGDFSYDPEDLLYLRSLISELSIGSGGEYELHFLIHVKDNDIPWMTDETVYQEILNKTLPDEFHGMGTLWSDKQLQELYPGMNDSHFRDIHLHGAYRSSYMPVQLFSNEHPEYDYIWHWEMDARYTGHMYHLFDRISKWARQQPRKGLWERNARFYVPAEHGSWEDFTQMVRVQTQHGTSSVNNLWTGAPSSSAHSISSVEKPIWGPEPPLYDVLDTSTDPQPPTSYNKDKYEWGVGEEADFISLNPLFDPDNTGWILAEDVTGYDTSKGFPPRRTAIITASRLSRRLLKTMHEESFLHKRSMFSEMWPGSCSLHHGYKAVYAPHPVYIDRRWPTDYLAAIFNGGRNGASGGSQNSPFTDDRQINFRGTTWYYDAGFSPNLWTRWLGYKVNNDGGEVWETTNEGRMCLPAMLLHPVKQVNLIYEIRS